MGEMGGKMEEGLTMRSQQMSSESVAIVTLTGKQA